MTFYGKRISFQIIFYNFFLMISGKKISQVTELLSQCPTWIHLGDPLSSSQAKYRMIDIPWWISEFYPFKFWYNWLWSYLGSPWFWAESRWDYSDLSSFFIFSAIFLPKYWVKFIELWIGSCLLKNLVSKTILMKDFQVILRYY